jgi:hypothetical protein
VNPLPSKSSAAAFSRPRFPGFDDTRTKTAAFGTLRNHPDEEAEIVDEIEPGNCDELAFLFVEPGLPLEVDPRKPAADVMHAKT